MEDGVVDRTVKKLLAAPVGLNGRLFSSFNFFSFLLIKTGCDSNYISDNAARTDEIINRLMLLEAAIHYQI